MERHRQSDHRRDRQRGTDLDARPCRAPAGKDVLTSCPANAFQVWKQNDNGWDQGNVFMTPDKVWLAPCGWAQRMARDGHGELLVVSETIRE